MVLLKTSFFFVAFAIWLLPQELKEKEAYRRRLLLGGSREERVELEINNVVFCPGKLRVVS